MNWITNILWLIPGLPLLAAGLSALLKQPQRKPAAGLAIGSMTVSFLLSCVAFAQTLQSRSAGGPGRQFQNFAWMQLGPANLELGWVLDPLSAAMLVMVTLVGLLIFIYSLGYMASDRNLTRFFCFLSLFAAAMLGLVIANSLLLLFICWELVGLASYLLIGFWYDKPAAAAAARKAFITTRIGDIGFFLGLLWLYKETGTLLFFDGGTGCLEPSALAGLAARTTFGAMAASTGISLLILCGAIGKSGQIPLHVWLPDAMEGPTPVSALIHAATMVAAGVFLVARMYPLMAAAPAAEITAGVSLALQVVTWIGAVTAVFGALVAVAQTDIKRILAYSTISQLGYMFMGLGVGGVAVGMFHLITHAFFKALLFLGAGSVIHGCHGEQDIRRMGGLRRFMPVTFATYAVGMMALSGVPLLFAGFWSKDEILQAASHWPVSHGPFLLGALGALLTAFYMTRQICHVFLGPGQEGPAPHAGGEAHLTKAPHESPPVMTVPLVILAVFAVILGFLGTPAWPWFQTYMNGGTAEFRLAEMSHAWPTMLLSAVLVFTGIGWSWRLYGQRPALSATQPDILELKHPTLFAWLQGKFYVDELYRDTVVLWNGLAAGFCDLLDRWVFGTVVKMLAGITVALAWLSRGMDEQVVNPGFDASCRQLTRSGRFLSGLQDGQVQHYLRALGLALAALVVWLVWGLAG